MNKTVTAWLTEPGLENRVDEVQQFQDRNVFEEMLFKFAVNGEYVYNVEAEDENVLSEEAKEAITEYDNIMVNRGHYNGTVQSQFELNEEEAYNIALEEFNASNGILLKVMMLQEV